MDVTCSWSCPRAGYRSTLPMPRPRRLPENPSGCSTRPHHGVDGSVIVAQRELNVTGACPTPARDFSSQHLVLQGRLFVQQTPEVRDEATLEEALPSTSGVSMRHMPVGRSSTHGLVVLRRCAVFCLALMAFLHFSQLEVDLPRRAQTIRVTIRTLRTRGGSLRCPTPYDHLRWVDGFRCPRCRSVVGCT
ncbi:MAG: hypothetical protein CM15mP18_0800 [Methanobacteriota archaeon]|nr:MAG: hypothetical protein CM15mP18_0800 [Euryarchaeota archaeon]